MIRTGHTLRARARRRRRRRQRASGGISDGRPGHDGRASRGKWNGATTAAAAAAADLGSPGIRKMPELSVDRFGGVPGKRFGGRVKN